MSNPNTPRGRMLELADRLRGIEHQWWAPESCRDARELARLVWAELTGQPVTLPPARPESFDSGPDVG